MSNKYFGGVVTDTGAAEPVDEDLKKTVLDAVKKADEKMNQLRVADALTAIFEIFRRSNKYIDETAPWTLAKDEAKKDRLATVLYNLTEAIAIGGSLLYAFMPETSEKILREIGCAKRSLEEMDRFGLYPSGSHVTDAPETLFARIDRKEIEPKIDAIEEKQRAAAEKNAAEAGNPEAAGEKEKASSGEGKAPENGAAPDSGSFVDTPAQTKEACTIDDFAKCEFRVGEVLSCEKVPKSRKLLCFKIRFGRETRQILSGIQAYYEPEQLVGKKVIAITNLPPRKMAGMESQGMLLSALDDKGSLSLLTTMADIAAGSEVG